MQEFDNFINIDFITSFAGMMALVWIMTQSTKSLFDKVLKNVGTRYVVFFWSVVLGIIGVYVLGDFSSSETTVVTIITWFFNVFIVWLSTMKAHELLTPNTKK